MGKKHEQITPKKKKDIKIAFKYMERWSSSHMIREMQIETTTLLARLRRQLLSYAAGKKVNITAKTRT